MAKAKEFSPLIGDGSGVATVALVDPTGGCNAKGSLWFNASTNVLYICDGTAWEPVDNPSSAGTLLALSDTANSYAGLANAFVSVNGAANGVEFVNATTATARLNTYVGASGGSDGVKGLVPVATAGNHLKFLRADGTYQDVVTQEAESSARLACLLALLR